MRGFDATHFGIVRQYGPILRGFGPPVPKAGQPGDLYIDTLTWQLFEKRRHNHLDDWGHYLFILPTALRNSLRWFGPTRPNDVMGVQGDFYMQWGGYDNYGMQPTIFGPKHITGWPENGEGPVGPAPGTHDVPGDTNTGGAITVSTVTPLGTEDVGTPLEDMAPNTLVAIGSAPGEPDYVIPVPVTANPGEVIPPVGVPSTGVVVLVTINPLYTAEDTHAI